MLYLPLALCTEFDGSKQSQNLLTFVKTTSLAGLITQVNMRLNSRVYQSPDLLLTVLAA